MLFDQVTEVRFELVVFDDKSFAEPCTILGAADVEDVSQITDILEIEVVAGRDQGIAQSCAVQIQI